MSSSLALALTAAQKEMPSVEKDATNPHFGNRFASLDGLIAKTRPVLNRHGLAIVQFPTCNEQGQPALRTILLHAESGERLEADMPLLLPKQDMQGLGSAITYARRYAWSAVLGITSEEDDDGQTAARPVELVTREQRQQLATLAQQKGLSADTVKELIGQVAGVANSAQVPAAKFDELVAAVEAEAVQL